MKDRKTTQVMGSAGRYGDVCERLAKDLKAGAVVLMVVDGRKGHGFSVATSAEMVSFGFPRQLAAFLRMQADVLEEGDGPGGIAVTDFYPTGEG